MRAVQSGDVALTYNSPHRNDDIGMARLTRGRPGDRDNYEFSIIRMGPAYTTPRHHHNFDQVHYVLEGAHCWAPDAYIPQGHIAYFGEGVYYGPQQGCDAIVLGLQLGGASESGFMDYDTLRHGSEALAEHGTFDDGVFRREEGREGPRNQDGYEAVWEHVHGAPLTYPAPRYSAPIIIDPGAFAWVASPDEPGVHHKHLITLTERRLSIGFTRLEPGAEHRLGRLGHPRVQYVVVGELLVDNGAFPVGTAFGFETGEHPALSTATGAELYWIDLPTFHQA